MANRNNPNGFTPVAHASGGEIRTEKVSITASNTVIGVGDPLMQVNDGTLNKWSSGAVAGIAAESKAANGGGSIQAYVDPNIIFEAQTDDGVTAGTTGLTNSSGVNLNATIIAGTASNGRSTSEIDESSGATTATLPLKILGLSARVGNAYGEFNRLLVQINNHVRKGGTGTDGL